MLTSNSRKNLNVNNVPTQGKFKTRNALTGTQCPLWGGQGYELPSSQARLASSKLSNFLITNELDGRIETPFLVTDLDVVLRALQLAIQEFSYFRVVIDTNIVDAPELVGAFASTCDGGVARANFGFIGVGGYQLCVSSGLGASQLESNRKVNKTKELQQLFDAGVSSFCFDTKEELERLIVCAPGSLVKLVISPASCERLSSQAIELLIQAYSFGLQVGLACDFTDCELTEHSFEIMAALVGAIRSNSIEVSNIELNASKLCASQVQESSFVNFNSLAEKYLRPIFGFDMPNLSLRLGVLICQEAGVLQTQIMSSTPYTTPSGTTLSGTTLCGPALSGTRPTLTHPALSNTTPSLPTLTFGLDCPELNVARGMAVRSNSRTYRESFIPTQGAAFVDENGRQIAGLSSSQLHMSVGVGDRVDILAAGAITTASTRSDASFTRVYI